MFPSEMSEGFIEKRLLEKIPWPIDIIPEQRTGEVEDMAGAVLFLASRAGGYINGNTLIIDGGWLSIIPATY